MPTTRIEVCEIRRRISRQEFSHFLVRQKYGMARQNLADLDHFMILKLNRNAGAGLFPFHDQIDFAVENSEQGH